MPPLSCLVAALFIGLSKSGFPGVGLLTVALMAEAFPARQSTGILLPLLIFGDLCAVQAFRKHTLWAQIARMLPPTLIGVVAGFFIMRVLPDAQFKPVLGWMLLGTVAAQAFRSLHPNFGASIPHSPPFAWAVGIWAGMATMMANAAGPIISIYMLSLMLPKENMIGTSAWFFLIVNVLKLPFSAALGLLQAPHLQLDLMLTPLVVVGTLVGRTLLRRIPQRLFEILLLLSAAGAALKLAF